MKSLENVLKRTILYGSMLFGVGTISQEALAQYNVHIKANTLDQSATGSAISGAVISKDSGDVVQTTNSNGEALLTDVGGVMSIKASHPDYKQFEQTFNITSDTTLYFAMPKTIRLGPWGTDTLNADWWKDIYATAGPSSGPTRWKQIIPVNVRIEGASVADSLNIVAAMDTMSKSTGWNLFKIVDPSANKDTTYTIYMNANTNISEIISNAEWMATEGYSMITSRNPKKITHEIVKSQDGWPTSLIPVPTNSNPSIQDMPLWQPLDGSYLSLKIEQDFRKKNEKQSLFIGGMKNYVALGNVVQPSIESPINNSIDLDTIISIIGTKDANALLYDFKIASDSAGNNIILAQDNLDRPRTTANLESGKTYFLFERARNSQAGQWSKGNKITTKSKQNTPPSTFDITSPIDNTTITYIDGKVGISSTPATDIDGDTLSKSYHVVGSDIDTIIHANNIETIYLDSARLKLDNQYTISAEVTDGKATTQASNIVNFRTQKSNGINDIIMESFKIYPNPTSDYINVNLESKRPTTLDIEIYDINGRLIDNKHEHISGSYNEQIDMTKYKTGMYIMQVHSNNELIETKKIIKE